MEKKTKINIRVPKWGLWLYWMTLAVFLTAAIFPNAILKFLFRAKWIEDLFRSTLMTIITIIAFLVMVTPGKGFAASVPLRQLGTVNQTEMSSASVQTNEIALSYAPTSINIPDSVLVTIPTTNIVSWQTNNGVIYVTTTDGNTHQVAELGLCAALIFGGIVIIVAGIGGCKIAQCAKKMLGTNQPPTTNAPPSSGSTSTSSSLQMPAGFSATMTNMDENSAAGYTAAAGWNDWQGNLIVWQYSMTVWPTNLAVGTNYCSIQSSTNYLNPSSWVSESYSVTGWVSAASMYSPYSNVLAITYDQYGTPFATNWYSLQSGTNGSYTTTSLGSVSGIPRRASPQLFFRAKVE